MVKVAEGQVGTSYTLPTTWQNKWTKLIVTHGDKGNGAQINATVDVLAPDGTVLAANQPINKFMWHPDSAQAVPMFNDTQRVITRVYDGNTGVATWKDSAGNDVDPDLLQDPLCAVPCDYIPISYDLVNIGNVFAIENVSGGEPPYQYSFDDSTTVSSSDTLDVSDSDLNTISVIPRVHDSVCRSANVGGSVVSLCDGGSWSADFTTPDVNVTSYVDTTGANRGWDLEYSTITVEDNFSTANDGRWSVTGDVDITGNGYMYFNLGSNFTGSATASRDLVHSYVVGEAGAIDYDRYFVYYGDNNPASNIDVKFQVVDKVTGIVLAENNDTYTGQWLNNSTNNILNFKGTGNQLEFRILDVSVDPTGAIDANGHYFRVDNYAEYDGAYSDTTHYAKKAGNHYLFMRGIDGEAVYTSDAHGYNGDVTVIPEFDIRRYGTLDDSDTSPDDVDKVTLQYQIDNGDWVTMLEHEGQFDAANEIYLSPYTYDKGVKVPSGSNIKYRMIAEGTGANNEGYYLYDNSDKVKC